ncbi:MAG: Asp-tRNA(Asn)/Glu-tRNA(Gln) amidotransferase subunit GatB [Acidobacteria bacterium]|nr:MAG: Asp-tRNA(Asn)/Glu-tRNA(Gln) amidotransferase subunit GatB [Acidobacteriota bacterium]REK02432.1 MAG: Asp-tRNA(Asn)/Glu-tRNA(Gln) amidotransferase subunit GatB [Acidobacteriota bacterium]REK13767.1 MAG: Asp-tRNA(Asn)/Glu-tRNA(Gln) amidotransferase subunit GatB [Acidobacteriota bacterium]REK41761.1 MAG: Asp-tRNA(Asn)/Glu-tRNA(Gln) amidotransferase subunit GatB [Acidobacteriota bacterium]
MSDSNNGWEAVIGMEIHAQLATDTKIFCRCAASFGDEPNSNTCPVCLGLPGALPVLNSKAVELGARAALALGLTVNETSIFARKNYFYPDLPKGYQISQYDRPFSSDGKLTIMTAERDEGGHAKDWQPMTIGIVRLHLEEDAGKNVHEGLPDTDKYSYVDLNRAGTPLAEIVTDPDFRSSWQAYDYVNHVRRALQWVGASDADMEKGNLRCEANVSVRKKDEDGFRNKVELKNLNSVRFMQKAIEYEIDRQIKAHESGEEVHQETRLWDEKNGMTRVMRSKEDAHDYRYFPEPDLQPLVVSSEFIEQRRAELPELPDEMISRFTEEYGLGFADASQLVSDSSLADYYEVAAKASGDPKSTANWILSELLRELNNSGRSAADSPVKAESLAELIAFISDGKISGKQGKEILPEMFETGKSAKEIINEKGMEQISDRGAIEKIVEDVFAANPEQVEQFIGGNDRLAGFFVGQVMKASKGTANPQLVNEIIRSKL